jgi:hypothetical protein
MAKPITFETVRKIALELPGVEEGTTHGSPALKIKGKLLAWIPANKPVEPNTLAVRIDFDQRDALIAEAPDTYYLIDHYLDYGAVLVRLSQIDILSLKDLLRSGWRFVTGEIPRK